MKKIFREKIIIINKRELNESGSFVEEILLYNKVLFLFFRLERGSKDFVVYNISKDKYNELLNGKTINKDESIGRMSSGVSEKEWIYTMQKTKKLFGNVKRQRINKSTVILSLIIFTGFILVGIGAWKICYRKALEKNEETTLGTVYSYSHARIKGKRYAKELYDIHVEYTVDGITYRNYYGQTANTPTEGMTVTVHYNSADPDEIINYENISDNTLYFMVLGGVMALVGITMIIPYRSKGKRVDYE